MLSSMRGEPVIWVVHVHSCLRGCCHSCLLSVHVLKLLPGRGQQACHAAGLHDSMIVYLHLHSTANVQRPACLITSHATEVMWRACRLSGSECGQRWTLQRLGWTGPRPGYTPSAPSTAFRVPSQATLAAPRKSSSQQPSQPDYFLPARLINSPKQNCTITVQHESGWQPLIESVLEIWNLRGSQQQATLRQSERLCGGMLPCLWVRQPAALLASTLAKQAQYS